MNDHTTSQPAAIAAGTDGARARKWFIASAGTVLAFTGIAKVCSVFGHAKLLAVADPIAGIPFRWLLLAVGVVELPIAGVCFFSQNKRLATVLVAWLATNFLVYRLGLWWMGWHRPCGCMGKLTDALHISEHTADNIMKVVLAYLLIGSYGLLLWQWRQGRVAKARTNRGSSA
jgi:hypothetical protein